jgi:hypothetical protein
MLIFLPLQLTPLQNCNIKALWGSTEKIRSIVVP